jgi:hypothetical protein
MKKIFLLATAALLITGTTFAHTGKGKKGKHGCCAKGKSCCKGKSKSTAKM